MRFIHTKPGFHPFSQEWGPQVGQWHNKEHFAAVCFEDIPPARLKFPSRDFMKCRSFPASPQALADNKHNSLLSCFQALSSRGEQHEELQEIQAGPG